MCNEGRCETQERRKTCLREDLPGRNYDEISADVHKLLSESHVSSDHVRDALLQGANDAARQIALRSPVSESEFERLVQIIRAIDGSSDAHLSNEYATQAAG